MLTSYCLFNNINFKSSFDLIVSLRQIFVVQYFVLVHTYRDKVCLFPSPNFSTSMCGCTVNNNNNMSVFLFLFKK